MGMDVHGRGNPKAYFRASIWTWPAILRLCKLANDRAQLGFDLRPWSYNDGAGLVYAADCERLATAIEDVLVNTDLTKAPAPEPLFGQALAPLLGFTPPPVEASAEMIENWLVFLRTCRGFTID